jgi:hypothetical protein
MYKEIEFSKQTSGLCGIGGLKKQSQSVTAEDRRQRSEIRRNEKTNPIAGF